jgi:hypothetical protein
LRFLQKLNPHATREGALMHAIGGGLVTGLVAFGICYTSEDFPGGFIYFMVPFMTAAGAVAGFAVYWQLPEDYY